MLRYIVIIIAYGCVVNCKQCRQVGETVVDCSHLNLTRVDQVNIPTNTTRLDLRYNHITILYSGDFKLLNKLLLLDLSGNPLETFQNLAFKGLWGLQSLILIGHELNYTADALPDDVFEPLMSLETLTIRSDMKRFGRKYPIIRDKPFGKLTNLINLNIDTTPKIVFGFAFSNMKKLKSLEIGKINGFKVAISEVSNLTFANFSATVESIKFDGCRLTLLESGSLLPFPFLKTFQFNGVRFETGTLSDIINILSIYEGKNMSNIAISRLYLDKRFVSGGFRLTGRTLGNICVENLKLANIQLVEFDTDAIILSPSLLTKCIKSIDLQENTLYGKVSKLDFFLLWRLKNLEKLILSKQRTFEAGHFRFFGSKDVSTGGPSIPLPIAIPPKLKYLDISGVIHSAKGMDVYIFGGENMNFLNISYCGLNHFNISIHGLQNLETLDLSVNDLSVINVDIFKEFPNLTTLRMSRCLLQSRLSLHGKQLLSPLQKLEFLDLSENYLVLLPYDIFEPLTSLQEIILERNKLTKIPDISSLPHLQHFNFAFNSLTTLNSDTRRMLERVSKVNASFRLSVFGNFFSCECSSVQFLLWLKEETIVALDGRNYSCLNADGQMATTARISENLLSLYRRCRSSFWLNVALSLFCITIVSILSTFVVVKNQMKIQLFLFRMLGHNICPRERNEFIYDLSVIHDESDYCLRFVHGELGNELTIERGINVNKGGADCFTTLAIANDIRDSWKIVLIITERFLNSGICLFTMCNCLSAITLSTPNKIVLLIDREPMIPTNVHFFMDSISEDNIFRVDLRNPLGHTFWNDFSHHVLDTMDDEHGQFINQ